MRANRTLRVCLEPEPGDRIGGRLYDERGQEHGFHSWLALLTLLEDARVRASSLSEGTTQATQEDSP